MNGSVDADVLVVGAGIQGATLAWELARRGLRAIVVERAAPGHANTTASFGLLHGGLRYLQTLDAARWARSRREQAWFAATLPALVRPLTVSMPLYRGSARSPAAFRAAFAADRLAAALLLPGAPGCDGTVAMGRTALPDARLHSNGVLGVARWQERGLSDAAAAVAQLLQRAQAPVVHGEPAALITGRGRVAGLELATPAGRTALRAAVVVLCAGAGTRALARRLDRDRPSLSSGILAFNLLLDLPAPETVLGVSPTPGRGRSLFLRGEGGRMLAGTWYAPWPERVDRDGPAAPAEIPRPLLERAVADLRACLPGADVSLAAVRSVRAGLLPDVDGRGMRLRTRDVLVDHGATGGPAGLWSLLGVKLTTARALSAEAVRRIESGVRGRRAEGPRTADASAGWR